MPIGDLLAQITGEPSPTTTTFPSQPPKRKANDDLRSTIEKTKMIGLQAANSSRPIEPSRKPSTVDAFKSAPRPSISSPASSTFKNGQPTPPPTNNGPKAAPKKGSFAEIMARGKVAQSTLGPVGKIQHKKIEKLPSRREREAMKAQQGRSIQKGMAPNSKFQRMGQTPIVGAKNGVKQSNGKAAAPAQPEKKIKKAATATTGYAGTARPKPAGQTASRPRPPSNPRDRYKNSSRYDRYLSEDEEDEEMEEEVEEQDYESDVSSDMEAAVFEVDEEEELAARIARKEDQEALKEENRLKKEKEEKKRRLMAMAKKAGARR